MFRKNKGIKIGKFVRLLFAVLVVALCLFLSIGLYIFFEFFYFFYVWNLFRLFALFILNIYLFVDFFVIRIYTNFIFIIKYLILFFLFSISFKLNLFEILYIICMNYIFLKYSYLFMINMIL